VTAQKARQPGVEKEAQKNLAGVAQHHDKGHQRPARPPDGEMAEVAPIDLRLLAGQGAQAQIGFRRRPRAMASDDIAEVIRPAGIAAFPHHRIEPAGRQRRETLQGGADKRHKGIGLGALRVLQNPRQAGLQQHPRDGGVMHPQMLGDGAHRPLLDMVIAQDLRLELRGNGHGEVLGHGCWRRGGGESRGGPDADTAGRSDDTAIPAAASLPAPLPGSRTAHHPTERRVNPDASRFYAAGSAAPAPHA
jgi:hypothetical protein